MKYTSEYTVCQNIQYACQNIQYARILYSMPEYTVLLDQCSELGGDSEVSSQSSVILIASGL